MHQHTSNSNSSPPTLSTLNLSSNNFSKELANLASLTNSSDNTLESPSPAQTQPSICTAPSPSISCDNQLNNHQLSSNDVVMDLSMTGPSSVDSALGCVPSNGTSTSTDSYLSIANNQTSDDLNDADQKSEIHHQPSSSASSTSSSGNYSTSTSQNVFESTAFSSNYLCTLLANLENEIAITQQHLDDENEKRHKYKVSNDD